MRLIDSDALKEEVNKKKVVGRFNTILLIDNAPTVVRTDRPVVILYDQAIYITQGHIDAMIEYERKVKEKEFIENFMKGLNDERT